MANDVRVEGPGPNGEGFKVNLKERSIGLTTKALLPIFLVVGSFALGIFAAKVLFLGQERGHQLLGEIAAQLHTHTVTITAGQQELRTQFDDALTRQAQALQAKVETLDASLEAWFRDLGQRLEILNFNLQNPDRTLPLHAPLLEEERR